MAEFRCDVCGEPALGLLDGYAVLPRVTSDCKPWPAGGKLAVCAACGAIQKLATPAWFDEIGRIYGDYEIYDLSDGAEQVIFTADGVPVPRSRVLADELARHLDPRCAGGRLLDIGCGNAAALRRFSRVLPGGSFAGSELSDRNLDAMRDIPGFAGLHTCPTAEIPGRFEAVTLIHSLEHMPDPLATLWEARGLMAPGAVLLVEVPDAETSPFDLLVADHLNHFTRAGLGHVAARAGIAAERLVNTVLPKENTLLGRIAEPVNPPRPDPRAGRDLAERTLAWLQALLAGAARTAAENRPFGIFGTSISGTWLWGALKGGVDFFVDEDATRIGRTLHGKPILAPDRVSAGATVYIPLAPRIAPRVADRLSALPVRFVVPPAVI